MKFLSLVIRFAVLASTVHALGPGKVCMFNAPAGAYGLGHVGWGYLVGGTSTWVYGATEDPEKNWHTSGTWSQMQGAFKNAGTFHAAGYYKYYKCEPSGFSSVGAANHQVAAGEASGYNFDYDNCLTKAIAIYKVYDSSTYGDLDDGKGWGPNYFFDNNMYGFTNRLDL